ncbi:MAG TPA: biotin/lipoyl-containing protein, partial [Gammaproteobacteria bacterium]
HLFERECSIQRRYQKIVEETPSPFLTAKMRKAMGEAAVAAAKAVNYVNAGTVEFIVGEDRNFYFMEMNTRLQVEHPVTEMTTNLDLVEWQLRVAAGEALPLQQDEIDRDGHAIEVRLYAENPRQEFLPSVGRLELFITPEEDAHFRVDTGVETGDEITIHYDPMIAKLVVWHEDRARAIATLKQALSDTAVFGLTTNLPLLRRIAADPVFAAGDIDTRYIDTHLEELNRAEPAPVEVLDAAALDYLLDNEEVSGFDLADGFQANALGGRRFVFRDESGNETTRFVRSEAGHFVVRENNTARAVQATQIDALTIRVTSAQHTANCMILRLDDAIQVSSGGNTWQLTRVHPFAAKAASVSDETHPGAPMPGRIVAVHVKAGDRVEQGQPLLVMEGMKMEVTVKARIAGTIENVLYAEGDTVEAEAPLVDIAPDA